MSNQKRVSDPVQPAQTPIKAPDADAPRMHADILRREHPPQCKPPHTDAGRCTTPKIHATSVTRFAAVPDGRRHPAASTASDNYLTDQTAGRGSIQMVGGGGASV